MVNDFDPTTNRIVSKLLTDEEREVLKSWPHGFQTYAGKWIDIDAQPHWRPNTVYRGKPAIVTITTWTVLLLNGALSWSYGTRSEALDDNDAADCIGLVRVDICNGVPSFTFEKIEGEEE